MNIGIIDSGVGGLTVLFDIVKKYPCFNYYYIGDSKNCPYGEKSNEEINSLSHKIVDYLIKNKNIDILIIACNSISSTSYEKLKLDYPNLIIIETVKPTAKYVKNIDNIKKIGVIATSATINSLAYQKSLNNYEIISKACPEFVKIVEDGNISSNEEKIIFDKLSFLKNDNIDALILGCTHFPLLIPTIKKIYNGIIITSSMAMIKELEKYIKVKNDKLNLEIYTTGDENIFKRQLKLMFNKDLDVKKIDL